MNIPTVTIADGVDVPQIGFGLWKVLEDTQKVVEDALEVGYRHLDTAAVYGNEREVGAAIAASGIDRSELFVTTKVWNSDQGRTVEAFEESLDKLGLDHVDLYLVHWPVPTQGLFLQAWSDLEKLHADGRARAIGVSNFLVEHLEELARNSTVKPAVNQIEVHPQNSETALRRYCAEQGIAVQAYSPFARGELVADPALAEIAAVHGVSIPQVILRWHVQLGNVPLPKTVTRSRMEQNLDVFGFALTDEQMAYVDGLDQGRRIGADPRTFTG
jgi:2,5-diketo-D-gluconate reductase A